jgi:hypothetical protein
MNPGEIRDMNDRIQARRDALNEVDAALTDVLVTPPAWADRVLDLGTELVAIHRLTAEPYPLDTRKDLSAEDHAIVVGRRILRAGGSKAEVERFLRAFSLETDVLRRLLRQLEEAVG